MNHVTLFFPENKVDDLIFNLHNIGVCELKKSEHKLPEKYSQENVIQINSLISRANNLSEILSCHSEKEKHNPFRTKAKSNNETIENSEKRISAIESKILMSDHELKSIHEKLHELRSLAGIMKMLPDMRTDSFESTENVVRIPGLIMKKSLKELVSETKDKAVLLESGKKGNMAFACVICLCEDAPLIKKTLNEHGFHEIQIPLKKKKPSEIIDLMREEILELEETESSVGLVLKKNASLYLDEIRAIHEELCICRERLSALRMFGASKSFSILEAWVPEREFELFEGAVKETTRLYYIESTERDDAPTQLNNSAFAKPFEAITRLYSVPKYKRFDPTMIIAVFLPLFFGFMLTDFVYGMILFAASVFIYFTAARRSSSAATFGHILMWFGVSTMILGIVFSSYFGDFWQRIGLNLPVVIDSMKQVLLTLGIVLSIGTLHMITGLVIGFRENVRNKRVMKAFTEQGVWIVFVLSILCMISGVSFLRILGLVVLVTDTVLQLFFVSRESGFISGLLSVFGFMSYVGDTFSYARLMALGIGTSGISLAVNFMTFLAMEKVPYAGVVLAVIIFIIGHTFNIVMNSLGGFIHGLRLHFLEFFQKFYEGGGKEYRAFEAQRKITEVRR